MVAVKNLQCKLYFLTVKWPVVKYQQHILHTHRFKSSVWLKYHVLFVRDSNLLWRDRGGSTGQPYIYLYICLLKMNTELLEMKHMILIIFCLGILESKRLSRYLIASCYGVLVYIYFCLYYLIYHKKRDQMNLYLVPGYLWIFHTLSIDSDDKISKMNLFLCYGSVKFWN